MPETTNQTSTLLGKPKTLDALTGLRFIAALAVILVHAMKYSHSVSAYNAYATNAVAFFFVLSGFILTYVYHDRLWQAGVGKFYFARFARIWPLHIVCMLAVFGVARWYGQPSGSSPGLLTTHVFMIQSWIPIQQWAFKLNGPAWSISTEFGFYFVFPLLLWLSRKRIWPLAIASVLATLAMVVGVQLAVNQSMLNNGFAIGVVYVNPLFRIVEFILGMWVGKTYLHYAKSGRMDRGPESRRSWALDSGWELLAIGLLAALFYEAAFGHLHEILISSPWKVVENWIRKSGGTMLGFAAVVWVFSWSRGFFSKLLSTPTAVYLGEISFALYLIQIPVLDILKRETNGLHLPLFYFVLLAVGMCIGLAMLLFAVIEMPCRQFLVSVVAGNWSKAWAAVGSSYQRTQNGYAGLIAIALLGLCVFLVEHEKKQRAATGSATEALIALDNLEGIDFAPVTFRDEAILLKWDVAEAADHLMIEMWWQILPGHRRARFLHISDEAGKIIYNGPVNTKDFVGATEGSFVVDYCKINKDIIKPNMKYVGIGFYAKGIGTAPADSGRRQMGNHRLIVAGLTHYGVEKITN